MTAARRMISGRVPTMIRSLRRPSFLKLISEYVFAICLCLIVVYLEIMLTFVSDIYTKVSGNHQSKITFINIGRLS